MSVAEVTGRISEIQAALKQLAPAATVRPAGVPAFSSVLGAAEAGLLEGTLSSGGAQGTSSATFARAVAGASGGSGELVNGQAVVDEAKKYLGVPYVWGGTDPSKGLDCSGLVQLVYKKFGVDLPRVSYQQATAGKPVASLDQAKPGDLLAFNSPVNHVGIYIGGGKMIEAPRTGLDVRIVEVYETPTAIRRVLPEQPAGAVAAPRMVGGSSLPGATPYASLFQAAGARHGVDPTLLAAIAKQESGYNPRAVSPAGAQGLMQLMPATAAGLGVNNSFEPAQAVDGAARLMKDLLSEFGRVDLALAAYNAGPGAVKRYGGIPPYPETQNYVPAVLAHKANLERA
ncbi:MAG: transglycosylase SLT domain-containing protein [Actinomycetota bacterium]